MGEGGKTDIKHKISFGEQIMTMKGGSNSKSQTSNDLYVLVCCI